LCKEKFKKKKKKFNKFFFFRMLQLSLRRLATASPAVAPAAAVTPAAPTPATTDFVPVQVKDHVMIIRMDAPGSKVNTLGEAMSRELEAAFKRAETEPGIIPIKHFFF
jgi:hypothetical protein